MTKQEVKREQTLSDMANKIAKLDKENEQLLKDKGDLEDKVKTLKKTIKGYKKIAKWCDKCEQIAELKAECDLAIEGRDVKIAELETRCNELFLQTCEQAEKIKELKSEIENDRDLPVIAYMQGAEKQKKKDEEELTKAKDHIKKLLDCLKQDTNDPQTNYYVCQYMDKAEQFLSEVEK